MLRKSKNVFGRLQSVILVRKTWRVTNVTGANECPNHNRTCMNNGGSSIAIASGYGGNLERLCAQKPGFWDLLSQPTDGASPLLILCYCYGWRWIIVSSSFCIAIIVVVGDRFRQAVPLPNGTQLARFPSRRCV